MTDSPRNRPTIREVTVVEVQYTTGKGVVGDPVRIVFAYFDKDGTLLAERDTWTERPSE